MGNQYSITVSEETHRILQTLKKSGYKVSQVIDEAVKTIGDQACARLIAIRRRLKALEGEVDEE
jgi:predicted CoA-binding protein